MSGRYSPGEIRDIAECLVDELRDWTEGTKASTWELLNSAGYDPHEFEPEELRLVHRAVEEAAEAGNLLMDHPLSDFTDGKDFADGEEPYRQDYLIFNSWAKVKCPRCGCKSTVRVRHRSARGQENNVERGGLHDGQTDMRNIRLRVCSDCGLKFAKPPLNTLRKKDGDPAEDYREIAEEILFKVESASEGSTEIRIRKNEEGAIVSVRERGSAGDDYTVNDGIAGDAPAGNNGDAEETKASGQISKEKWDSILHTLYARMYLHEWRKRFENPFITGGTQWELRIGLTGGRRRTYRGNMYPVYWVELRRLMMSVFGQG